MIRRHGLNLVLGRDLFSLHVSDPLEVPRFSLPSQYFACLIAWDSSSSDTGQISTLIDTLLHAGASYFVCWGPDCRRVHDVADEIIYQSGFLPNCDTCITTTWHSDESLDDAIEFFLLNSIPDDFYAEETRSSLAISIESEDWERTIIDALADATAA